MDAAFWIERWEKQQTGFHQQKVNPYLNVHWASLNIPAGGAVFVPLCGKSLDMQWLRAQGHTVVGVELSRKAVEEYFSEQQIEPRVTPGERCELWESPGYRLMCGDFFALDANDLKDVQGVFDRASLIAFPPGMRQRYVEKLSAIVPSQAPTLLVSLTYPQHLMSGPPFSVREDEVRRLYAASRIEKLQDQDVLSLAENARFKERGVDQMSEQVYRIGQ
jgi:thiopurine S-methyltransferase